jgi:zinc protease
MPSRRKFLTGTAASLALFSFQKRLFAAPGDPITIDPKNLPVVEKKLDNGLRILFLEDHSVPSITYWTFFKVGSRNERDGITGISHFFEHMMFNGAKKYGPKEFDRQLERAGGSSNAYTQNDITAYYEDFPPESLELVIDLESDRMRSLQITQDILDRERGTVKEERRMRTDDDPQGALEEELYKTAFAPGSGYHWPVIGWMKDLDAITVKDMQDYFKTHYAPNNATVIVVGDFNADKTFELIKKYYSDISKQDPAKNTNIPDPVQTKEKRVTITREVQLSTVMMGYKTPATMTAGKMNLDVPKLDLLQFILANGESSRLYKTMVYEKELCVDIGAYFQWSIDPGLFIIYATLAPGADAAKVEAEIDKVIADIVAKGVTEAELKKAKTQFLVNLLRDLSTNNGRGNQVGNAEVYFGSYKAILDAPKNYEAVKIADIQATAKKYLVKTSRTVATLAPKK